MMDSLLSWRPHGCLDYLLIYIAPGALLATYLLINKWRERPSEFARGLMSAIVKKRSLWDQFLEYLVLFIAFACVLFGWPVFVIWFPFHWHQEKKNKEWQALPDFDCAPQYLVHQITPNEAEALNIVYDPLGFAPEIAFGHFHKAWKAFVARIKLDEELWSFLVPVGGKTGKYQFATDQEITGFARMKNGAVVEEFLY
jgi:hypothetical protein